MGKSVFIHDVRKDPSIQYSEAARKEGIISIFSVPISVKEIVTGVLRIYTSQARRFSDIEIEFISILSGIGGIAIDNAMMYDLLEGEHESLNDWKLFLEGIVG